MDIIFIGLGIHVVIQLVLLLLRYFRVLKFEYILWFVSLLIPVWGTVMLLYRDIANRNKYHNNSERYSIELNKTKTDITRVSVDFLPEQSDIVPIEEALLMNDESYQKNLLKDILYDVNSSIVLDNDDVVEKVVPLQEAMVLNDSGIKRALVMDVLYSNPSDYISQLVEAKKNDDTEVVHYAVTALVELQKEFDLQFDNIQKKLANNPDDEAVDREYLKLQERYISCGLLEGDGLTVQRVNYRDHLRRSIEKGNKSWHIQSKLADVDLQLNDLESLQGDVEIMMERWPEKDSVYYYRIQLAALRKDSEEIAEITEEIKQKDIYISARLRELLQFWSD